MLAPSPCASPLLTFDTKVELPPDPPLDTKLEAILLTQHTVVRMSPDPVIETLTVPCEALRTKDAIRRARLVGARNVTFVAISS